MSREKHPAVQRSLPLFQPKIEQAHRDRKVVSASKRTDIPAFYLPWFAEGVKRGWIDVPNPMFRNAPDPSKYSTHVVLTPERVSAIVWWSKNYAVLLRPRFQEIFSRFNVQYFHFTINSRSKENAWLEPDVPSESDAISQIRRLARLHGPSMIAWRNDPICFWTEHGVPRSSWDPEFFERMCRTLTDEGIETCFTSLADSYRKFIQRLKVHFPAIELRQPTIEEVDLLSKEMISIARRFGMAVYACTESELADRPGFRKGACIDGALLGATKAAATDRKMKGREECGCTKHVDIGDYVSQECGYSCVYCYANPNHRRYQFQANDGSDFPGPERDTEAAE